MSQQHEKKRKTNAPENTIKAGTPKKSLAFAKENYIFLIIGVLIIALGFIFMVGGSSEDPKEFNPEIFNFRRTTLAPILVLLGFAVEIYAIMKKPKQEKSK